MDLSTYKFPKITDLDLAFSVAKSEPQLLLEAKNRNPTKGIAKFDQLFYGGGKIKFKSDVKDTWKENAWRYCRALMGSGEPRHEDRELICGMLIEECLEL